MRAFDQYYSVLLKQAVSGKWFWKVKQISSLSTQADDWCSSQFKMTEKTKISASPFLGGGAGGVLLIFVSSLAFVSLNLLLPMHTLQSIFPPSLPSVSLQLGMVE